MPHFKPLEDNLNIQKLIKETFDADLPVHGDWGYTSEKPTVIEALPQGMPLVQLQHTLGTIRAHLEMNITQEEEDRYAGINANEKSSEILSDSSITLNKVTYEITAIEEKRYHAFIKEYKAGYESKELDLNDHFKRRKEATVTREVTQYFDVTQIKSL